MIVSDENAKLAPTDGSAHVGRGLFSVVKERGPKVRLTLGLFFVFASSARSSTVAVESAGCPESFSFEDAHLVGVRAELSAGGFG